MKNNGSLNRIYRLVWSQVTQGWVAVSETSSGQGKSASRKLVAAALLLNAAFAYGGPVGGAVTSGLGQITQAGNATTITQGSTNLSLNWQSFNLSVQDSVTYVQPSASSIAINRINDTQGSQILARIKANGQVYLINPNGIMFGKGAEVNVGALVASTLDVSDSSLGNGARTFIGAGTGSIVNQGSLLAGTGGYVALLGHSVSNSGSITAPQGFVGMGAGQTVTLSFQGNAMVGLEVAQSALNALADNGGLIRADGGQVVMSAGAKDSLLASVVNNSGTIEARTVANQPGRIVLLGGMAAGTVALSGTLDASAPQGGAGGFVETSAARVSVAGSAVVSTAAPMGPTGTWLIDPSDFTVSAGHAALSTSGLGAATLSQSLLNNNVSIATSSHGIEAGDIHVKAPMSWSANQLSLTAHRDININAVMSVQGTAKLDLQPSGHVNVGFNADGSFAGRVDFVQANGSTARTGSGFLRIGQHDYTVIASADALQGMSQGAYVALGSNITTTEPFVAIAGFTTAFDGLGHTVANLNISGAANTGLFATATGASIQNVGLLGGSMSGAAGTGALVGHLNDSTVRNSYSSATVSGAAGTGGLVGSMVGAGSSVVNSHAAGNVGQSAGGAGTGGLVGSIASGGGDIVNSYATGNVTSTGTATGGLVGSTAASGAITDSYATGQVQGDGAGTGGLVGSSAASAGISNSFALGKVESVGAGTGGLVGSNTSGAIFRSFALGQVNGGGAGTGGLVGSNTAGTISESFAAGTVYGSAHSMAAPAPTAATVGASTGGLVGSNSGILLNTYAAGNVTGYSAGTGGLVGYNDGTVTNSYAAGQVVGAVGVGGLIGSGTLTNSNSFRLEDNAPLAASSQAGTVVSSLDLATFDTSAATQPGRADWDFNTIWTMPTSSAAYVYPVFKGLVKHITVTASDVHKTYDGQAYDAANNRSTSSSVLNAALVTLGYDEDTSTWVNAGAYSITPEMHVANAYLSPYFVVTEVAGNLTVAPKILTATATAANKVYDGSASANATLSLSGLVAGESLGSSNTASFNSQNVLAAHQVTVNTATLLDGTGLASNYSLAAGQVADAVITAKALTATATVANKAYDSNTAANATLNLAGLVSGEALSSSTTANFNSQNVLTANKVTVNTAVLTDTATGLASNYSLTAGQQVDASITAKALTATASAANKTYDGSTAANATLSLSGLVSGEALGTSNTASFNNANVLAANKVTVNTATLADTATGIASNYSLAAGQMADVSITAKALTATATATNKAYDGSTTAKAALSLSGLVTGEDLGTSNTASFNNANVLTANKVTVNTATLADNATALASNYTLAAGQVADASITAKALTATATATNKTYDGSTAASATLNLAGLVSGEALGSNTTASFNSQNVLAANKVTVNTATLADTATGLASNYRLDAGQVADASITAKALTATATAANKTYDGSTTATATLSLSGLVSGEALDSNNTASFNSHNVLTANKVTVNTATLTDTATGLASNYTLAAGQVAGASITAKVLAATAAAANKVYDGNTVANASLSLSGLVSGEALDSSTTASFNSQNVLAANKVTVNTATLTDTATGLASNYSLAAGQMADANITPKALNATATAANKIYDGSTTANATLTLSGLRRSFRQQQHSQLQQPERVDRQ